MELGQDSIGENRAKWVKIQPALTALALGVFYSAMPSDSVLQICPNVVCLDRSAEGIEDTKAHKQLAAATKEARKGMPKDPAKLWDWLTEQDQRTLLAILAVCAGHTVDAVQKKAHNATAPLDHADELAAALKLDMAEWWEASASGYFARVSKQQILEAVGEAAGPAIKAGLTSLKKGDLAKAAEKRLKGKGWLPPILRAPAAAA
jgi:ParB family transcriptional regulator, chromosome partitioning protein